MFIEEETIPQIMMCGECGHEEFGIRIDRGKIVTTCAKCKDESHILVFARLQISDSVGSLCRSGKAPDGGPLPS